jgi:hypothetical protein
MYCALLAVGFRVCEEWVRGFDGVEVWIVFPSMRLGMMDV